MTPTKRAPAGLGRRGKAVWRDVMSAYELNAAELAMLAELAATLDEVDRLTSELANAPVIVEGSTGQPRAHPLLAELREHRRVAERLAQALALPIGDETIGRRRSPAAKAAANSRWNRAKTGPKLVRDRTERGA